VTPFELWQRGEGPEPVVVAELPAEPAFLPPWTWGDPPCLWEPRRSANFLHGPYWCDCPMCTADFLRTERAEAAEEQRAALEAAFFAESAAAFAERMAAKLDQRRAAYEPFDATYQTLIEVADLLRQDAQCAP